MSDERNPVTSADIDGLRGDTGRLATSVDNLAERQRVTDEAVAQKADQDTVDELATLQRGKTVNRRLALLALALVILGLGWAVKSNGDRINDQNSDRRDRSRGSCIQFNVNQQNQRTAIVQSFVDGFGPLVKPEDEAKFEQVIDAQRASVSRTLPYRDCSDAGIEAFLRDPPPDPNAR